jgi:hypothetical protein
VKSSIVLLLPGGHRVNPERTEAVISVASTCAQKEAVLSVIIVIITPYSSLSIIFQFLCGAKSLDAKMSLMWH